MPFVCVPIVVLFEVPTGLCGLDFHGVTVHLSICAHPGECVEEVNPTRQEVFWFKGIMGKVCRVVCRVACSGFVTGQH